MSKTPIIKQEEYTKLLQFIASKGKARSYEITAKFNEHLKNVTDPDLLKKRRCNFSMKIQILLKYKFIQKTGQGYRTRKGKYSIYNIDWEGMSLYFLNNYFTISPMIEIIMNDNTYIKKRKEVITTIKKALYGQFKILEIKKRNVTLDWMFESLKEVLAELYLGLDFTLLKKTLKKIKKQKDSK